MGDYFFDRLFHSPGIYSLIAHLAHRLSLDVDHCLGTLKLKGIKLHPEIEFFDPNESELMEPIYEAGRRYHVPIIFHTGMSSKASPGVIAELAARYKDFPVILGHMGVSEYVKLAVGSRARTKIFFSRLPWSAGCRFCSKRPRYRHQQNSFRFRSSVQSARDGSGQDRQSTWLAPQNSK